MDSYKVIMSGGRDIGETVSASLFNLSTGKFENLNNLEIKWIGYRTLDLNPINLKINSFSIKITPLTYPILKAVIIKDGSSYESNLYTVNSQVFINKSSEDDTLNNVGSGMSYSVPISSASGSTNVINNIARINQSIVIILTTAKGSVPMIPTLGCNIHNALFSIIDQSLLDDIEIDLEQCILEQEPRISTVNIETEWDYDHTIRISIEYTISDTNIKGSLIYDYKTGGDVA